MQKKSDIFNDAVDLIRAVAKKYNYKKDLLEVFLSPDRIVEVSLPIDIKGEKRVFTGFRVQHSNKRGPYKGGIRFHESVTREEVSALSLWMSLKTSLVGLPFGGAKGGIAVNPKRLTEDELESLSRNYIKSLYDLVGPSKDIPAPDVNTNPKIINWMVEEYVSISRSKDDMDNIEALSGAFTGKSIDQYGLDGRVEATGFGGAVVLREIAKKLKKQPTEMTVAVQGFGNVGYYFSKFASEFGFRIVTVSDSKGGVTDKGSTLKNGLDVEKVLACKLEKGVLAGCYCVGGVCDINEGKNISNDDLLGASVDILVPSALENAITETNMKKVKASIVIEMANGPVSPKAHDYLIGKGIIVVPDILANAGGVTASYLEWKQNLGGVKYKKEVVLEELDKILSRAFEEVWQESETRKTDMKTASYGIALKNLLS